MANFPPKHDKDPIGYLVWRRFPRLSAQLYLGTPDGLSADQSSLGIEGTEQTPDMRPRLPGVDEQRAAMEAYTDELSALSEDQLAARARAERAKQNEEARRLEAEREEAGRFHNRPGAIADWPYWAKQAYWTIDEAVALSLGKDPRIVTWERLRSSTEISPFAKKFADQRDLFNRAVWTRDLFQRTLPPILLAWARSKEIEMPPALLIEMEKLGIHVVDAKPLVEEATEVITTLKAQLSAKQVELEDTRREGELLRSQSKDEALNEKGRGTFQKMILGMALEQYAYNPADKKSTVPKQIADDLRLHGIELTEKTVRDILRAAAERYPEGERS